MNILSCAIRAGYNQIFLRAHKQLQLRFKLFSSELNIIAVGNCLEIRSGAFAQVVLGLENLAPLAVWGIYDLQAWLETYHDLNCQRGFSFLIDTVCQHFANLY